MATQPPLQLAAAAQQQQQGAPVAAEEPLRSPGGPSPALQRYNAAWGCAVGTVPLAPQRGHRAKDPIFRASMRRMRDRETGACGGARAPSI
eukprot:gene56472-30193_t